VMRPRPADAAAPAPSLASRGAKRILGVHVLRASNPRRRRRGVRGAKGRDAEGVQGVGNVEPPLYPPPQPTRGSGGAS